MSSNSNMTLAEDYLFNMLLNILIKNYSNTKKCTKKCKLINRTKWEKKGLSHLLLT